MQGLPRGFASRTTHITNNTPYGQVLQSIQLSMDTEVWLAHPFPLLHRTVRECPPFRNILRKQLERHPCTVAQPWNNIIYFDEVTPTDPCSTKTDTHKVQCLYWTWAEFAELMFVDAVWFVVSCAPSVNISRLATGMSEFVKRVLQYCCFNTDAFDFEHAGLLLDMSENGQDKEYVRLFAKHTYTLCDVCAMKELLCSLGQNALKPCPSCQNVVKDDVACAARGCTTDDLRKADLRKGWARCTLQPVSSLDAHLWKRHTDQSVRDMQTYLGAQKATLSETSVGELETRMGYKYSESSIINDPHRKCMSTARYDWVHAFLCSGICTKEIDAFVQLAKRMSAMGKPAFISFGDMHSRLESWSVPACWRAGNP